MTTLTDSWAQDVASECNIPAISPPVCRHLLPVIEMQIRKIIQQAHKFQKRGKGKSLTVEDINLALSLNGIEEIYGLCPPNAAGTSSSGASVPFSNVVNLLEYAKLPIPKCPLLPELSLHWLAVDGVQPLIPENPSVVSSVVSDGGDMSDQPLSLPKEIQHFYYRTTGLILACDHAVLPVVLDSLRKDVGLQELVPYFSKFIYSHIRATNKSIPLLRALISTVSALITNKAIRMEFHLQQLLPAVFTCIVAPRLSPVVSDHWALRKQAALVISQISLKYSEQFPDFHVRFCKTYIEVLTSSMATVLKGKEKDKDREKDIEKHTTSLVTMYGALVGLTALGHAMVRAQLLPITRRLLERINLDLSSSTRKSSSVGRSSSRREMEYAAEKCRTALLHALGTYMVSRLRLPPSIKQEGTQRTQTGKQTALSPVCGFQEALVPYYASASSDLYYCRLFI